VEGGVPMKIITHSDFAQAYKTLDLPVGSSFDTIHSAYRKLALNHHPDGKKDLEEKIAFEEKLKKLNIAHELLRNHFKGTKANHTDGAECVCQPTETEKQVVAKPQPEEKKPQAKQPEAKQPEAKQPQAKQPQATNNTAATAANAAAGNVGTKTHAEAEPNVDSKPEFKPHPHPRPESGHSTKPEAKPESKPEAKPESKPGFEPVHGENNGSHSSSSNSGTEPPGQIIVLRPSKISPESVRFFAACVAAFFAVSLLCSVGMNQLGKFLAQHDFSRSDVPISARAGHSAVHFVDVDKVRDAQKAQEANRVALEKQTKEEDDRHKYDDQIKSHLTRIYDDQLSIQSLNAELEQNWAVTTAPGSSSSSRSACLKNVELCKQKLFAVTDDLRNASAIISALRIAHPEIPTEYFAPIPVPPIATNLDPSRAPKWSPTG
jgi:curved DNA-binding protein CbpA